MKKITQDNIRFLLSAKIATAISLIATQKNITAKEALLEFYNSDIYKNLEIENSKYWWLSGEQLGEDFMR